MEIYRDLWTCFMTFTHFHADWPGSPQRKQRGATRGWCLVDSFDGSRGAQHQVGRRSSHQIIWRYLRITGTIGGMIQMI